ncbi:hypothetical protein AB6A40_002120 [Gnathostoma spinigerum]|uniref:Uncharacterized protein n=1 Tax=Gnathostoma spinigerum TaxID=75299 RepID=A0ABD6E733_9BILA
MKEMQRNGPHYPARSLRRSPAAHRNCLGEELWRFWSFGIGTLELLPSTQKCFQRYHLTTFWTNMFCFSISKLVSFSRISSAIYCSRNHGLRFRYGDDYHVFVQITQFNGNIYAEGCFLKIWSTQWERKRH